MFVKYSVLIVFVFSLFISLNNSYVFDCLDGCECETEDEVIHCNDNSDRNQFQTPKSRLGGFTVLRLTNNNLKFLPSEELLQEKFPQLKAVDVEGNSNFDCSTLDHYKQLQILSDCGKDLNELNNSTVYVDIKPKSKCDTKCQLEKHYEKMHEYFLKVWKELKKRLAKFSKDHQFVADIQNFLAEVSKRITDQFKEN